MNAQKVLNIVGAALVIIGSFSKLQHYPIAGFAILVSAIVMLLTLFMYALKDNKEAGLSVGANYFMVLSLAVYIIGAVFKTQHWPVSEIFLYAYAALTFIFPFVVILQKTEVKVSRQYLITFATFFILITGLLLSNSLS